MAFSWKQQKINAEKHLLYRYGIEAKTNPDFRIAHPELSREAETGNTNVELKKFIAKKIEKQFKYGEVPKPSTVIKRYNRVVG